MSIDRRDTDERNARIELMMEQYSAAERRRMIRRGIALWNRAEELLQAKTYAPVLPPKVH
jgi:hypothetical protein